VDMLNWTATEAFHPADILNSRNLDSDLQNYEKVGEPMVSFSLRTGAGTFTLYHMPTFIEPILASTQSRLSLAGGQAIDMARLNRNGELTDDWFSPQFAARWTKAFDNLDLSLHVIHHQDRSQPSITLINNAPVALFQTVTQIGGTYQQVMDAWLLKLELGWRLFHAPAANLGVLFIETGKAKEDHGRIAFGIEYGFAHESGAESTLIVEGQAVVGPEREIAAALDIFQADLLIGYRLGFNDIASTSLLVSAIFDVEFPEEIMGGITAQRRLDDTWTARATLRFTQAPALSAEQTPHPIQILRDSDHLSVELIRHF